MVCDRAETEDNQDKGSKGPVPPVSNTDVCVCVCVCGSPLRSCPERPGPQVVLCLGIRSEVRNGVCLCSSRYARSSRWAELVAGVVARGEHRICQHTC